MQYVVYQRSESGAIERCHTRITLSKPQRATQYPHPEKLTGWAERTVFWTREFGTAVGVAPKL